MVVVIGVHVFVCVIVGMCVFLRLVHKTTSIHREAKPIPASSGRAQDVV